MKTMMRNITTLDDFLCGPQVDEVTWYDCEMLNEVLKSEVQSNDRRLNDD
jgi:hypothetical protein